MNREDESKQIESTRIIAIRRSYIALHLLDVASVLIDAGVTTLEISMVTPSCLLLLEQLATQLGDRIAVGADILEPCTWG